MCHGNPRRLCLSASGPLKLQHPVDLFRRLGQCPLLGQGHHHWEDPSCFGVIGLYSYYVSVNLFDSLKDPEFFNKSIQMLEQQRNNTIEKIEKTPHEGIKPPCSLNFADL